MSKNVGPKHFLGTILEAITLIACFVMVGLTLLPVLIRYMDVRYNSHDTNQAHYMTSVFQPLSVETRLGLDAHDIRQILRSNDNPSHTWTPQSRESGFFYHALHNQVLLLDFNTALTYLTGEYEKPKTIKTPAELFGEGLILISEEGSDVTALIHRIAYQHNRASKPPATVIERLMSSIDDFEILMIRYLMLESPSTALKEHLEFVEAYYSPEETLFVDNHQWFTLAENGENIRQIVFQPGMSHVPRFDISGIKNQSIHLEEVILPTSIRTVSAGAFGSCFDVERLIIKGEHEVWAEKGAFIGVRYVDWIPSLYMRDDPHFEIDAWHEGQPLITYDLETLEETLTLDLSHIKAYFVMFDIQVVSYHVALNLSDMQMTRVYVYTENGYYGFVVPVEKH